MITSHRIYAERFVTSGEAQILILDKELNKLHYEKSISKYFYMCIYYWNFISLSPKMKVLKIILLWNFPPVTRNKHSFSNFSEPLLEKACSLCPKSKNLD